jgi:hypothetical protein
VAEHLKRLDFQDWHPVAEITQVKGEEFKTVSENWISEGPLHCFENFCEDVDPKSRRESG